MWWLPAGRPAVRCRPARMYWRTARRAWRRIRTRQPARRADADMRQCCRSFGPPRTIRCPIAAGAGNLESARSLPIRMTASRWLGTGPASASTGPPHESSEWHSLLLSPLDSASPESGVSIRDDPTQYKPNLSEEEPLLSASTFNCGSASVMRFSAEIPRSRNPPPVADLRHVVAMLADIELVTLHGGPEACRRLLHLIVEAGNSLDGIERELIAVEIV
jgi:hypothetical protein